MKDVQLGAVESRFADIIWEGEPLASSVLAKRAEELLGWKKTTSYTVLKRLCDKGLFKNEKGTVSSLISKEDFYAIKSESFVEDTFGGSLPAFFAAFTKRKSLSADEIAALRKMVDEYEGGTK
ncbi:MAG: BlaI/MecI/CopY family transcriptional regulator [Clostridia bacterium]|nr:BlaI/MecI/CopY family transcriptional regulator [Clostridia bacterium]